jgi:dipeptidyl aminopeptidase/acylaminoacyl peptidase
MHKDIRRTALYEEAESLYKRLRRLGTGQISDAVEIHASRDGSGAVFAGSIMDRLAGSPPTRICHVDLTSGSTRVLTFGPNTDRLPRFSPTHVNVAFLSDRHKLGDFQLYLLDPDSGAARPTPQVDGWVEYLHWSPDGQQLLLGVAGHGADISGGQGAVSSQSATTDVPSWTPLVETGDEDFRWRSVWIYDLTTDSVRQASPAHSNIWEAVWCGNKTVAAVASPGPGEGLWYTARLYLIDIANGECREIYKPADQLGWPAASPSGTHLAVVDALCSDRWIVAGDLRVIETASGKTHAVDTQGIDIAYTEWRSDRVLLLAGHRGLETVIGTYDTGSQAFTQKWSSQELTTGGRYVTVAGLDESGDCVLVGESFSRAPEIAVIRSGQYRSVRSFDLSYSEHASVIESARGISWRASDGLEIQGWLLQPRGAGPYPLIMDAHGGPVWQRRPMWLGRRRPIFSTQPGHARAQGKNTYAQHMWCPGSLHATGRSQTVPQCAPRKRSSLRAADLSGRRAQRSKIPRRHRLRGSRCSMVRRSYACRESYVNVLTGTYEWQ